MSIKRIRLSSWWLLPLGICLALGVALGAGPALRAYRMGQARKALENHHPDQALKWLEQAAESDPQSADVQFLLARANRKLGNLTIAGEHLKRAWKLGYPGAALQREQWMALAQTGQLSEVESKLADHLSRSSEDAREICEAIVAGCLCNYDSNAARNWLDAWEADFPRSAQPHFFRGLIWRHFMLYAQATDELNQALELDSTRDDIRFELAKTLEMQHKFDEAIGLYRVCCEHRDDDPQILTGLANCLVHLGEDGEAETLYQDIVRRWPEEIQAHRGLAKLELAAGRPEDVLQRLAPLVREHGYDKELRYVFASALRSAGQHDEAETHFAFVREANKALGEMEPLLGQVRADPKLVSARYQIGRTLMLYASPAKGAAWLRTVLELDPRHRPTHQVLADYYARQKNERLAEHHRQLAESLESTDGTNEADETDASR